MTDAPGRTLLEVSGLDVRFPTRRGPFQAVDDVAFEVGRGEIVSVVGETGCGKTVSALSILGLLPPRADVTGSIRFEGGELLGLRERELRRIRGARISMVFQNPALAFNPVFPVGRQMELALAAHGIRGSRARSRIDEALHEVGLPDPMRIRRAFPHELSGGMLQRAMIATALLNRPALLIADEPTTALDVTIGAQILELLRRLQREEGFSVLLITHDLGVVRQTSDRVVVLYAGRVAETAATDQLFAKPTHPYTEALIAAVPRIDGRHALRGIPGALPADPGAITGCPYADRCPLVIDRCRIERPALLPAGDEHRAACHVRTAASESLVA